MLRRFILLLVSLVTVIAVRAQFTINQMPVFLDTISGNYLCSIPEEYFGNDMGADIEFLPSADTVAVASSPAVSSMLFYTFTGIQGGKVFDIPFVQGNDTTYYHVTFTYLPIVVLKGQFGFDYVPAEVNVLMPGDTEVKPLAARVKWRGASTNETYNHKRNYHIKFVDDKGEKMDRRFFGLRKDNSWLLDAGQIDLARVRNHVGMTLWGEMAARPFYSDLEPEARNYVRSVMVEVMLNDEYRGIFAMGEAMDRKQLKLKKFEEDTKVIHGQLWKTYDWHAMVWMTAAYPTYINNNSPKYIGYETKYPELDDVSPTDYVPLSNAIVAAVDSPAVKLGEFFDLPVIRDYYILFQVLMGFDNDGKNLYWASYDSRQFKRLTLAAWDLDATVGQYWTNEVEEGKTYPELDPEYPLKIRHNVFKRLLNENPDNFVDDLHHRYSDLRRTLLSDENLVERYTSCIDTLLHSGAAFREELRWSCDSDIFMLPLDFRHQRQYIADWLLTRLHFLDRNEFNLPSATGDVSGDLQCDVTDVNMVIDMVLGKSPVSWRADFDGNGVVDVADVNRVIDFVLGILPDTPPLPDEPPLPDATP